jgi:hypothetical protein
VAQSAAEETYLVINFPNCGESMLKSVAWLVSKDNTSCQGCSSQIDLKKAEAFFLISEAAKHCARMDAELSKKA